MTPSGIAVMGDSCRGRNLQAVEKTTRLVMRFRVVWVGVHAPKVRQQSDEAPA